MSVHSGALGFDGAADAYDRGRPTYPDQAVEALVERLRIGPESTVLDVAAGTGKFTSVLAPRVGRVVAVEPLEGMWRRLVGRVPEALVAAGTAERIPLASGSVDGATVAQAFHWFRGEEALAELHRVLRPGAGLALIWNKRDERVDWVAALSRILDAHEKDTPRFAKHLWENAFQPTAPFTPLDLQEFTHAQQLDVDGLVDRVVSISFVAALAADDKAQVVEQVRALVSGFDAPFDLPYRTQLYTCRRR